MMRCSPEAFAKCPTRALCGNIQEATFTEGSECDLFNRTVCDQPVSNADKFRMLSDEALVTVIQKLVQLGDISGLYCKQKEECATIVSADGDIPDSWCSACLLEWLQSSVEGWLI